MDIKDKIDDLEQAGNDEIKLYEKRELRHEYREQKDHLRQEYREHMRYGDGGYRQEHREQRVLLKRDYKEQKRKIEELREAAMMNVMGRFRNNISGIIRILVAMLLVGGQFALILSLPVFLHQYTIYFYLILEVFSFLLALALTNANKSASYKVAWMSIALLFPISGHIMYYMWGRTKPRKRIVESAIHKIAETYPYLKEDVDTREELYREIPEAKRMSKYMSAEHFPLYKNNRTKYYPRGEQVFKDMFEDMLDAKKFILVNFFIVAEGAIWDMMHEIMQIKVSEGVEVIFIYDDFGAMLRTEQDMADKLNREGIKTMVFNPIRRYTDKLIMNYRSHEKIVVIDGEVGYTGGFNLADEYANLIPRFGVWKDCGIRVEGDAVWGLTVTFMQMWSMCRPDEMIPYLDYKTDKRIEDNDSFCHVISDGPTGKTDHFLERVYKQMIADADEKLYIMTPYLILEDHMVQSLVEAVKRGVDVRIITPNIPDKKSVKLLTEYNYGPLLEAGVRIYEYTPGFIHSKVIMNEFAGIVGTVNMDYRSFYLHYENAVWLTDRDTLKTIEDDFLQTFDISAGITYEKWLDRPFSVKVKQIVLNLFATMV